MPKKFKFVSFGIIVVGIMAGLSFAIYTHALNTENKNYPQLNEYIISLAQRPEETDVYNEPDTDYRYQGIEVNNYLSFNNELWRIVGVFGETTHGIPGEALVKIMHDEAYPFKKWDGKENPEYKMPWGINNWLDSDLYHYLNGEYNQGINKNFQNMIQKVSWKLGAIPIGMTTVDEFYENERGQTTFGTNASSIVANIGLIYPSDYAYSLRPTLCPRDSDLRRFHVDGCHDQSWIFSDKMNQWLITSLLDNSVNAWAIGACGDLAHASANNTVSMRPTLYLKSDVKIVSGSGTQYDPYIINI